MKKKLQMISKKITLKDGLEKYISISLWTPLGDLDKSKVLKHGDLVRWKSSSVTNGASAKIKEAVIDQSRAAASRAFAAGIAATQSSC